MTIVRPAARTRSAAASSITPSWNHTPRAAVCQRLVGDLARAARVDEDVDDVHVERDVRERRVADLAVHGLGPRVHRHDPLADALQEPGHAVRRRGRCCVESPTTAQVCVSVSRRRISAVPSESMPSWCPGDATSTLSLGWTHEFPRADRRGVALRQRPPAHRPRLRLRCALRRLLPLPADGGRRGAHGLGHRRARHPDPGAGRRGGAHPARARRQVQPRDRERPAGPRAVGYDLFTRTTTSNHYEVVQKLFPALYRNGYVFTRTAMGAISPSTGRTLPDRYIEGTCPICGYDGARGDQCDNCGNQLDPADLINPRSKINGEVPKFVETEHFFLDLPAFAELARLVAVHADRLAAERAQVRHEPRGRPQAARDHPRPRLGRAGAARRLAGPADEAALRLVRRGDRLPVGVGRVGAARPGPGRLEAVVDRPAGPCATTSWARTTSSSTRRSGPRCCWATNGAGDKRRRRRARSAR